MVRSPVKAHVLCLQGSLGVPSRTAVLLELVARLLQRQGATTETVDMRDVSLPQVDPRYHGAPEDNPAPAVGGFLAKVRAADAMVWASPVYHNSYSGALKNAIDHLSIADVRDKPLALCGNGGRRASVQATDHLRIVARSLHGIAVPLGVTTANGDYAREGDDFRIRETEVVQRSAAMCDQLLDYVEKFRTAPEVPTRAPAVGRT
ncbi:NADPH-dependent FMN reductase [Nocardiopsis salina]|uniref:NADPH-dependent FMN reductase n=1 Tax=Nocardiopsis salina TaxID=245836 RepID=UPI00037EE786|nr:NADPH-dependent FMN reductase [Nocardiopsis salina]